MKRAMIVRWVGAALLLVADVSMAEEPPFRAGAAVVDVSPAKLPVIVNGGFLEARADTVHDRLDARAIVLDDGSTRLAICVVDTCMMPRELIDRAKALASDRTGIALDRILVSATHTHTAPSAMGALGSRPDPDYVEFLPGRIAEAIALAIANLEPALAGWSRVDDFEHTHCRRWIRRPDRMLKDPFGNSNVRANMHPGHESPDVVGPAGPVDPGLSVLAVRALDGRPIAMLANYSMHYFGTSAVSADYYGRFRDEITRRIGAEKSGARPFVAIMSQGTSGDQQWMDYGKPRPNMSIDQYAAAVAAKALEAYDSIEYQDRVPLAMSEARINLRRRAPNEARLAWARPIVAGMGERVPKDQVEVYAKEAIYLNEEPERELILQAIRVGELGIAAIPDEVYALTGLKIKARSPLESTFTIELANGSEGYIPPPEQHALGGYTTWPARTAALEVEAEPRIVDAVLGLLERVSSQPRRAARVAHGAFARAILAAGPVAYWRLEELDGDVATDATGHARLARLERGYALHLDGPTGAAFSGEGVINRAVHLAGGRLVATLPPVASRYSVSFWFWSGLPSDARPLTGELLALEVAGGEHLAIAGSATQPGRLLLGFGDEDRPAQLGQSPIEPRSWHQVMLTRDGEDVLVYLDGQLEIQGKSRPVSLEDGTRLALGGHTNLERRFEGKIDEVALFDRVLAPADVTGLHRMADPSP